MKKTLKKLYLVLLLCIGVLNLTGCGSKKEISITDYNGVYKKDKNIFYVVATDKDKFEYYVIDELGNKNYGTLEYRDGVAINDDFDELVKLKLEGKNLAIETKNITNFKAGTYKKIEDYNIDKFYEESYGLNDYYGNEYNGKYTNDDLTIYMYQPAQKYIEFLAVSDENSVSCEINIEEQNGIICEIFDTKYIIKLNDSGISYIVDSNDEEEKYDGILTKVGTLSKEEIINNFDPVYVMEAE